MSSLALVTVSLGELLGLNGALLNAILVGQEGLNGWWVMSTGLDAKNVLRLVVGSSVTFLLAHAVHFISTFPF